MTEVAKLGFWASKSKGAKAGIIIGITAGVALLTWGIYTVLNKDKSEFKPKDKDVAPPKIDDASTEEKSVSTPNVEINPLSLPNKGVGCSELITNFDRDFDYVKCGGIWYTKSKENPSNASAKDKHKDWTSLEKNEVATKLLATRYPKL